MKTSSSSNTNFCTEFPHSNTNETKIAANVPTSANDIIHKPQNCHYYKTAAVTFTDSFMTLQFQLATRSGDRVPEFSISTALRLCDTCILPIFVSTGQLPTAMHTRHSHYQWSLQKLLGIKWHHQVWSADIIRVAG